MTMPAFIQILKVGELTPKTFEGRSYTTQEAECVLLNEHGETECIGVFPLSEAFKKSPPERGTYMPIFSMRANPKNRRIESLITGLTPVAAAQIRRVVAASQTAPSSVPAAAAKV